MGRERVESDFQGMAWWMIGVRALGWGGAFFGGVKMVGFAQRWTGFVLGEKESFGNGGCRR